MILGVGADIMRIDRLRPENLRRGDPFFDRAFSPGEIAEGLARPDSQWYFAARFAGKEALFKALGLPPEGVEFCEMEILNDENGTPRVNLSGSVKAAAEGRGVGAMHISLSYEDEYVAAFAVAEGNRDKE